ncbi:hypothetical protein [Pseudoclavibacter sp. 13-3]|uniref:hypothetical protein n=1 Tax=Pseudoclavibacter sp. 13-3 TaxID=2901228 RepID=UPI001E56A657|nr:hypothetical protein [Pseudoclavibacter sp. 13-3]MCD7101734.1 hypothetical protein [Pseudoclavibacter sp. 13-3]
MTQVGGRKRALFLVILLVMATLAGVLSSQTGARAATADLSIDNLKALYPRWWAEVSKNESLSGMIRDTVGASKGYPDGKQFGDDFGLPRNLLEARKGGYNGYVVRAADGTFEWSTAAKQFGAIGETAEARLHPGVRSAYPSSALKGGSSKSVVQRLFGAKSDKAAVAVATEKYGATAVAAAKSSGFWSGTKSVLASGGKFLVKAGNVWMAQSIGTWIGHAGVSFFMQDADFVVCDSTGGDFLGMTARYFSGADCSQFQEAVAQPNVDVQELFLSTPSAVLPNGMSFSTLSTRVEDSPNNSDYYSARMLVSDLSLGGNFRQCYGSGNDSTLDCAEVQLGGELDGDGKVHLQYVIPDTSGHAMIPGAAFVRPSDKSARWGQVETVHRGEGTGLTEDVLLRVTPSAKVQYYRSGGKTYCGSDANRATPVGSNGASCTDKTAVITAQWADKDPDRTLESCTEYTDGSKDCAEGEPFKESGSVPMPPTAPVDPSKQIAGVSVGEKNAQTGVKTDLGRVEPDDQYKSFAETYPSCTDGSCELDLVTKATGKSCFDDGTACSAWFSDPDKATKYGCTYGGQDVALEECTMYSNAFKASTQQTGKDLSDPETGADVGQTSQSGLEKAPADQCWSEEWGNATNPIDWVFTPVKCALVWAFVPNTLVFQDQISEAAVKTKFGTQLLEMTSAFNVGFSPSGCDGIPLDTSVFGSTGGVVRLGNSCEGSLLYPLRIVTNLFLTILILWVLLMRILRWVSGSIGHTPMASAESESRDA